MKLGDIETPITNISGVGPSQAQLFAQLNVFTIADLLQLYPKDWEDRTKTKPLCEFSKHHTIHTAALVIDQEWFGVGKMKTLKIKITDGTQTASLICFNRPFLQNALPINSIISITGHFYAKYNEIQSSSFEAHSLSKDDKNPFEKLEYYRQNPLPDAAIYAIYPLTAGLSQKNVRKAINKALSEYCRGIDSELPLSIIEKYNLYTTQNAILKIHTPSNMQEAIKAKKTLIFEELYAFQIAILKRAQEHGRFKNKINPKTISLFDISKASPRQKILIELLPFDLTDDQKKVIEEMNVDIDTSYVPDKNKNPTAAARLLQGDVGSGKTLAAFFSALRIIDWGGQVALLAPTEILAKQHAQSAAQLLEATGIKVAFLNGNIKAAQRKPLLKALKNGDIDILIGTHALFSKDVIYKDLRLAIIDEQHRFGVIQRNLILDKGRCSVNQKAKENALPPNLLMMSATPIPQTLALTVYGDLDVSTIKTMPKGRKPIQTHLTVQGHENRVYEAVRKELQEGHQAYFVYPLIENQQIINDEDSKNSAATPLKSAVNQFNFLSEQVYPEYNCTLVHSKIDDKEQNRILNEFRAGAIHILIATTVVEVGVDVPNATCMVIEQAERFGLAALHQLRGRVGRSSMQSHCFLIYSKKLTELGKSRLKVMHESTDGFYLSEQDLKLRGPGEVNGIQQSGYLTLGIADPIRDRTILEWARTEALLNLSKKVTL